MKNPDEKGDDGKTFDMYHFFSRKDVLLAGAAVLILLAIVLYLTAFSPTTV